jgi:hypothetical protein
MTNTNQNQGKLRSYSFCFFKSKGPTLSPVALLCFTWLPSHSGKVPDLQHLRLANASYHQEFGKAKKRKSK